MYVGIYRVWDSLAKVSTLAKGLMGIGRSSNQSAYHTKTAAYKPYSVAMSVVYVAFGFSHWSWWLRFLPHVHLLFQHGAWWNLLQRGGSPETSNVKSSESKIPCWMPYGMTNQKDIHYKKEGVLVPSNENLQTPAIEDGPWSGAWKSDACTQMNTDFLRG